MRHIFKTPGWCECTDSTFIDQTLVAGNSYLIHEWSQETGMVLVEVEGGLKHYYSAARFIKADLETVVYMNKEPDEAPASEVPGGSTPSQYALPETAKELQDLIEYREMNFAVGNIFKACYRLGRKEGASMEYDLNKIIFFAQRELNRIKK